MNECPHIKTHAGDAAEVSIGRGDRTVGSFADRQQLAERAPLMRVPICGRDTERLRAEIPEMESSR